MPLANHIRPFAILSVVGLAILAGCAQAPEEKSAPRKTPNKTSAKTVAGEVSPNKDAGANQSGGESSTEPESAAIVSPVDEFQHAALAPAYGPLPQLAAEPQTLQPPMDAAATQPKLAAVHPPVAANSSANVSQEPTAAPMVAPTAAPTAAPTVEHPSPTIIHRPMPNPPTDASVATITPPAAAAPAIDPASPLTEKHTAPAKKAAPSLKPIESADGSTGKTAGKATRPTHPVGKPIGTAFDPIKENGPIFVGWTKPQVALALTGVEHGYIEPCGCSGLDRMKGGMRRRFAMIKELRDQGWPVVPLDVGGLARGFGLQAETKFRMLVESKDKMGYRAIGFGPDDLRLPAASLVSVAAEVNNKPSMFLSANVGLFSFDAHVTQTSRVIDAGGRKIGVTAVLGRQYQKEINNSDLEMIDPAVALAKIVPELKQKSDFLVLLANTTHAEAIELAKKFPEFNVVVVAEGPEVPPALPETVPGSSTWLITVGHKGMDAIVVGLYDDPKQPMRYQRVPLDSRFDPKPDAKNPPHEMKDLMAAYQEQIKTIGFAGLGLQPTTHPQAATNGRFVGSQKCESCHESAYHIWKKSKHAVSYDTLQKLDPPRNFDPECVSCHVIGWNADKFFPYASGFESVTKTPHLVNVGCEDCHGPGERHVAAEMPGGNVALREQYRKAVRLTLEDAKKRQCSTCHDLDNSRDFNFDTYWPVIEHNNKDE